MDSEFLDLNLNKNLNNNEFFRKHFNNENIFNAFLYAKEAHSGQKRKSGEDYIIHPVETALKLHKKYTDETLTIAGLLHDTVEDCEQISIESIYDNFGPKVGFIVDALNKREKTFYGFPKKTFENKITRFLWAGLQDIRVFLVKIADRENNLKTIGELKEKKQVRMTFETQAIFHPLKNILEYDHHIDLKKTNLKFEKFIIKNNLDDTFKNIDNLKQILYNESFEHFDENLFDIVYENSSHVVWKIEGWEMYDKLCSQNCFKDKVEILKVQSNGENVYVDFKFKTGMVPNKNNRIKMKISTFNQK